VESCEARAEGFWYYLFKNKPPLVVKLHTPEGVVYKLNRDPLTKDRNLIERLEEWWICRANKLIGLSKSIVELTQNYYKVKFNGIPIVLNPIDINIFKPKNILNNKGYILYVGRLEFRKGVHVLAKTIPFVLKNNPQVKFIFIGSDCGMKDYLKNKIEESGSKKSVEFIDQLNRDNLISYYQQSAICIFPSLWENHPYVILEAMACGRPVIASNVGGIPEIIKDRVNGILVPAGSTLGLTDAIIEVLTDKRLRETLGINARKFIEEQYPPEKVTQKTLNIYKELTK
jgi:glycosyltransferase involved in cell wall biosynthesis